MNIKDLIEINSWSKVQSDLNGDTGEELSDWLHMLSTYQWAGWGFVAALSCMDHIVFLLTW